MIERLAGAHEVREPADRARGHQTVGSELVESGFLLRNRPIEELMVPRAAVTWLDADRPSHELRQTIAGADQDVFPVCRGGLAHILGTVGPRQIRSGLAAEDRLDLTDGLPAPLHLPRTLRLVEAVKAMRNSMAEAALVTDEDGVIVGMVTARGLLEALADQALAGARAPLLESIRRRDGSWLLDGLLPVAELRALFGCEAIGGGREQGYRTLAGFVMARLDRLPTTGDALEWEGLRIEVVDMDGRRIDKLLVTPLGDRAAHAIDADEVRRLP